MHTHVYVPLSQTVLIGFGVRGESFQPQWNIHRQQTEMTGNKMMKTYICYSLLIHLTQLKGAGLTSPHLNSSYELPNELNSFHFYYCSWTFCSSKSVWRSWCTMIMASKMTSRKSEYSLAHVWFWERTFLLPKSCNHALQVTITQSLLHSQKRIMEKFT